MKPNTEKHSNVVYTEEKQKTKKNISMGLKSFSKIFPQTTDWHFLTSQNQTHARFIKIQPMWLCLLLQVRRAPWQNETQPQMKTRKTLTFLINRNERPLSKALWKKTLMLHLWLDGCSLSSLKDAVAVGGRGTFELLFMWNRDMKKDRIRMMCSHFSLLLWFCLHV